MKKLCPACHEPFGGKGAFRHRWRMFGWRLLNFRPGNPVFSFPCLHCGTLIRPAAPYWECLFAGFDLFIGSGVYLGILCTYHPFRIIVMRHLPVVASTFWSVYAIGLAVAFWSIIRVQYRVVERLPTARFRRLEAVVVYWFLMILAVQFAILPFLTFFGD